MFALQNEAVLGTVTVSQYPILHLCLNRNKLLLWTAAGLLASLGGPFLLPSLLTASNAGATFLTGVTVGSVLSHWYLGNFKNFYCALSVFLLFGQWRGSGEECMDHYGVSSNRLRGNIICHHWHQGIGKVQACSHMNPCFWDVFITLQNKNVSLIQLNK